MYDWHTHLPTSMVHHRKFGITMIAIKRGCQSKKNVVIKTLHKLHVKLTVGYILSIYNLITDVNVTLYKHTNFLTHIKSC